jgi:hypothetical protein
MDYSSDCFGSLNSTTLLFSEDFSSSHHMFEVARSCFIAAFLYHLTPSVYGLCSFYILYRPWFGDVSCVHRLLLLIDVVNSTETRCVALVQSCADYGRFEAFYPRQATLIMCSDNVSQFAQSEWSSFDFVKTQAVNNTLVNVRTWVAGAGNCSY